MLNFTQGDTVTFDLLATLGNGQPFDLSGAVFTSYLRGPGGSVVSFANAKHLANPDQVTYKGKFTLSLDSTDSASVAEGYDRELITKVVQGASTIYFRKAALVNVFPNVPVQ